MIFALRNYDVRIEILAIDLQLTYLAQKLSKRMVVSRRQLLHHSVLQYNSLRKIQCIGNICNKQRQRLEAADRPSIVLDRLAAWTTILAKTSGTLGHLHMTRENALAHFLLHMICLISNSPPFPADNVGCYRPKAFEKSFKVYELHLVWGEGDRKPRHSRIDNCKLTVTLQCPTKKGRGKRSVSFRQK